MDINHGEYQRIYEKEKFNHTGLNSDKILFFQSKYGKNTFTKRKKTNLFIKIIRALTEPMILILLFACVITVGINIGNKMAGKESDFYESLGIIGAILLSVGLTVFMENKSERAFEALQKLSDAISVSVFRDGEKKIINCSDVTVGDLLFFETGDKIVADCLIIDCNELETEESVLSGESEPIRKKAYLRGEIASHNMLYSGSYVKSGNAKCIALGVGENAQIGKIATTLSYENTEIAPLTQKLNGLSKKISIFGAIAAMITFTLTLFRLYSINDLNFETAKEAFIQAVVLIVAAVPEGLPATVAIALTLSMVKLAKSNAIIKKLVAAETIGCVSVICSDKTGTLTVGKMQVSSYVVSKKEIAPDRLTDKNIIDNVLYNSTAYFAQERGTVKTFGNSTEQALIFSLFNKNIKEFTKLRSQVKIIYREAFSSERKYMLTQIQKEDKISVSYLKGSIEKVISFCAISDEEKKYFLKESAFYEKRAERIIAFAHKNQDEEWKFDGFCVISDVIRQEVYQAVKDCKNAGISIKILTGDNKETAFAIAKKIGILFTDEQIFTGAEINAMTDGELKEKIKDVTVVARSTPESKYRIVKALKSIGEIVAVTGDGVNDAPAIKNADIGIAMGDGSEITKEAADIILLDNSFLTIVKAIDFGRNIYRNFQRFLFFQLTVNFSAVGIVLIFLLLGFETPFSALQLLWINIIMDGPLALSLGVESREKEYMQDKPVKRDASIVSKKMFFRTAIHAMIITVTVVLQKLYNFIGANVNESKSVIFALFVFFQLFNAVNARETGHSSILKSFGKNKLFTYLLLGSAIMQVMITQFFCKLFITEPLRFEIWVRIFAVTFMIILLSELYKLIYRCVKNKKSFKKIIKRRKFA